MKKKLFIFIFSIVLFTLNNTIVFAVNVAPLTTKISNTYNLLAPIGNITTFTPTNLGTYFTTMLQLAIGLCAVLAVIMIVIGGIQWMGDESVFGKTEAKSRIVSAILGLLIALGSYVLLNTINPDLTGKAGITVGQVSVNIDPDTPQGAPPNGQPYPYTSYKYNDNWPSDTSEIGTLAKLGITVKKPTCISVGQYSCTSVYQLNMTFVSQLKNHCPSCELNITGGTEFWLHGSNSLKVHYPGGWVVDLEETPTLKTYVTKLTKVNLPKWRNGGADCYYDPTFGLGLVDEGDHYHAMNGKCDVNNQGNM